MPFTTIYYTKSSATLQDFRMIFLPFFVKKCICTKVKKSSQKMLYNFHNNIIYIYLYLCYTFTEVIIMVKHIILWTLKEYPDSEKKQIKDNIKKGLEGLKGKIDGLVDIKVYTEGLASSNADLMLDSSFTDEAALKNYAVHPEHVAVADGFVRPYTALRSCLDFEI